MKKINLNTFLAKYRVLNQTLECSCGNMRQTIKYILIYCLEFMKRREDLYKAVEIYDYLKILATLRETKVAINWL